jgi:uncharacterized membrane protein
MGERIEALLRIPVGFISAIVIGLWKILVQVIVVIHWIYAILTGKRSKGLAEFGNRWVTCSYQYLRYMTFSTNKRPFPFNELGNDTEKVDLKK